MKTHLIILTFFSGLLFIAGCNTSSQQVEKPLELMMDRSKSVADRLDAAEQAEADPKLSESVERIRLLKILVLSRSHPDNIRSYALDALLRLDREATLEWLSKQLHQIQGFEILDAAVKEGIADQRLDFTPGLSRRMRVLFRDLPDEERPELMLLEELHEDTPAKETMLKVLQGEYGAQIMARTDTWEALTRLMDRDELKSQLDSLDASKNPLHDIKDSYTDFGILPLTRMDLLRLQLLRLNGELSPYSQARQILNRIPESKKENLALRDLPILLHLYQYQRPLLNISREDLIRQVSETLDRQPHFERTGRFKRDDIHVQTEKIAAQVEQLSDFDLLTLSMIMDAMKSEVMRIRLFNQAEVDLEDKETEHGGLITWDDQGRPIMIPYPAKEIAHDNAYISPKKLIVDAFEGLAHYHFHAQKERNVAIAGPGDGDMEFAENTGLNCVVFTFIDKNRLNVDYFNERGVVIDLGVISKP